MLVREFLVGRMTGLRFSVASVQVGEPYFERRYCLFESRDVLQCSEKVKLWEKEELSHTAIILILAGHEKLGTNTSQKLKRFSSHYSL